MKLTAQTDIAIWKLERDYVISMDAYLYHHSNFGFASVLLCPILFLMFTDEQKLI